MSSVSIPKTVDSIKSLWAPHLIANVNDHHVKIAKIDGDFIWHAHPNSDELFYLLEGKLYMDVENEETVSMSPGDVFVVPKGVRHKPRAANAVILMMEHESTVNTGDQMDSDRTVSVQDARQA